MLTAHNTTTTTIRKREDANKQSERNFAHTRQSTRHLTAPSMNLGALARSLSNSLRFGVGSKKQPESTAATATPSTTSSLEISNEIVTPQTSQTQSSERKRQPIEQDSTTGRKRHSNTIAELQQHRPFYKQTVEEILQKISELEHTLYENQQQEFKLRISLEQQTERVNELDFSLDTEKMRNQRLVHLLRGIDTDSSSDSEPETKMLSGLRVQSSGEIYGSISPLLMQQR